MKLASIQAPIFPTLTRLSFSLGKHNEDDIPIEYEISLISPLRYL